MRSVLLFILLLNVAKLHAQSPLFENYSSEQGLSQNSCYCIAQDAEGFMWFGTQDGLNRYDGREFKVYLQQSLIGKKLPSNYIENLFYDSTEQCMWIGSARGSCLYILNGDSLQTVSERFSFAAMLDTLPVKKIVSFTKNEYWLITPNRGLLCLNLNRRTITPYFDNAADKTNVTAIVMHQGNLVVSLLHELYLLKPSGKAYVPVPVVYKKALFPQINQLFSFRNILWVGTLSAGCYYITQSIEDERNIHLIKTIAGGVNVFMQKNDNELWIGSRGSGIFDYNMETGTTQAARKNPYDPSSPVTDFVMSVYKDRQGITWFGLSGGIAKYDPLWGQFSYVGEQGILSKALPEKSVYKLYKARNGRLYIGTQSHGILEWKQESGELVSFPGSARVNGVNNMVYDITENTDGHIWAATVSGLMELNPQANQIKVYRDRGLIALNRTVALLKLQKADSLLVATENGLFFFLPASKKWLALPDYLQRSTYKKSPAVYTPRYMYEDENNTVWICTEGAGLIKYDYLKQTKEAVTVVNDVSLFVRHLLKDGNLLWLATDNGLVVYDCQKNKIVQRLVPETRNHSTVCYAVLKDNDSCYWVSTNFGLYKIGRHYDFLHHYSTANGLRFLEYNTACAFKDTDGSLYFGGVGGFTYFYPQRLKENHFSPPPVIINIKVKDSLWPAAGFHSDALRIPYNKNFLSLQFAVTNFSNEKNNQFSYRLKGLNDNWSQLSTANTANFTSLPPGDYVFELRSVNSDGKWSDGTAKLVITILKPWWQTWTFRIIAAFLIAALVFYFVRRRVQSVRRDATLKQQMAELEMKGLHAQMNPHFIFNSLNSIKEMIWSDDKQNASRYLSKFAQLIRTGLEQSRQTFITVEQCIDHLQQYLEMEKLRFEKFSYSIITNKASDISGVKIAPMLVQPLVENALWHGLGNKEDDRQLFIRFSGDSHNLICEIEDNGIGIRQSIKNKQHIFRAHHSLGIVNIKERLEVLNEKYNMNCSLTITDKSDIPDKIGSGTIAVLCLTC